MIQIALCGDEGFTASLYMKNRCVKRFSSLTPKRITISSNPDSSERMAVERFIEDTFLHSYGATITEHYPHLMSVYDSYDNILAAAGFRYAKESPLFLEKYLDAPIEQVVAKAYNRPIGRHVIAEIGNLSSKGNGASIFLFTALNAYLEQCGIRVNTVTATDFLYRYFRRLGLKATILARADQNRLDDRGKSWGKYYDENPQVIAGHVQQVLSSLQQNLQLFLDTEDMQMRAKIHVQNEGAICNDNSRNGATNSGNYN